MKMQHNSAVALQRRECVVTRPNGGEARREHTRHRIRIRWQKGSDIANGEILHLRFIYTLSSDAAAQIAAEQSFPIGTR